MSARSRGAEGSGKAAKAIGQGAQVPDLRQAAIRGVQAVLLETLRRCRPWPLARRPLRSAGRAGCEQRAVKQDED